MTREQFHEALDGTSAGGEDDSTDSAHAAEKFSVAWVTAQGIVGGLGEKPERQILGMFLESFLEELK